MRISLPLMLLFFLGLSYGSEAEVVTKVSRIVLRIYDRDHIDFDSTITDTFNAEERRLLKAHKASFVEMAGQALASGHSIWGAKILSALGDQDSIDLLKDKLYTPQPCYGWEGLDYTDPSNYVVDQQFQYSVVYLESILAITGKTLAEAAPPTKKQKNHIAALMADQDSEFHHWAQWISLKLRNQ